MAPGRNLHAGRASQGEQRSTRGGRNGPSRGRGDARGQPKVPLKRQRSGSRGPINEDGGKSQQTTVGRSSTSGRNSYRGEAEVIVNKRRLPDEPSSQSNNNRSSRQSRGSSRGLSDHGYTADISADKEGEDDRRGSRRILEKGDPFSKKNYRRETSNAYKNSSEAPRQSQSSNMARQSKSYTDSPLSSQYRTGNSRSNRDPELRSGIPRAEGSPRHGMSRSRDGSSHTVRRRSRSPSSVRPPDLFSRKNYRRQTADEYDENSRYSQPSSRTNPRSDSSLSSQSRSRSSRPHRDSDSRSSNPQAERSSRQGMLKNEDGASDRSRYRSRSPLPTQSRDKYYVSQSNGHKTSPTARDSNSSKRSADDSAPNLARSIGSTSKRLRASSSRSSAVGDNDREQASRPSGSSRNSRFSSQDPYNNSRRNSTRNQDSAGRRNSDSNILVSDPGLATWTCPAYSLSPSKFNNAILLELRAMEAARAKNTKHEVRGLQKVPTNFDDGASERELIFRPLILEESLQTVCAGLRPLVRRRHATTYEIKLLKIPTPSNNKATQLRFQILTPTTQLAHRAMHISTPYLIQPKDTRVRDRWLVGLVTSKCRAMSDGILELDVLVPVNLDSFDNQFVVDSVWQARPGPGLVMYERMYSAQVEGKLPFIRQILGMKESKHVLFADSDVEGMSEDEIVTHDSIRTNSEMLKAFRDSTFKKELNISQCTAIESVLRYDHASCKRKIFMWQGPPGSGKSSTLSRLLAFMSSQASHSSSHVRVMVCGPSNQSVHVLVNKVQVLCSSHQIRCPAIALSAVDESVPEHLYDIFVHRVFATWAQRIRFLVDKLADAEAEQSLTLLLDTIWQRVPHTMQALRQKQNLASKDNLLMLVKACAMSMRRRASQAGTLMDGESQIAMLCQDVKKAAEKVRSKSKTTDAKSSVLSRTTLDPVDEEEGDEIYADESDNSDVQVVEVRSFDSQKNMVNASPAQSPRRKDSSQSNNKEGLQSSAPMEFSMSTFQRLLYSSRVTVLECMIGNLNLLRTMQGPLLEFPDAMQVFVRQGFTMDQGGQIVLERNKRCPGVRGTDFFLSSDEVIQRIPHDQEWIITMRSSWQFMTECPAVGKYLQKFSTLDLMRILHSNSEVVDVQHDDEDLSVINLEKPSAAATLVAPCDLDSDSDSDDENEDNLTLAQLTTAYVKPSSSNDDDSDSEFELEDNVGAKVRKVMRPTIRKLSMDSDPSLLNAKARSEDIRSYLKPTSVPTLTPSLKSVEPPRGAAASASSTRDRSASILSQTSSQISEQLIMDSSDDDDDDDSGGDDATNVVGQNGGMRSEANNKQYADGKNSQQIGYLIPPVVPTTNSLETRKKRSGSSDSSSSDSTSSSDSSSSGSSSDSGDSADNRSVRSAQGGLLGPLRQSLENLASAVEELAGSQSAEEEFMTTAELLFCTLAVSGRHSIRRINKKCGLDLLVIDEAAQAVEAETWVALQSLPARLLLVGDPKQLSATVTSNRASELGFGRSLMERLMWGLELPYDLLMVQYRMHPAISKFPVEYFYESRLVDGPNVVNAPPPDWFSAKNRMSQWYGPYVFLDIQRGCESQGNDLSYVNQEEAVMVARVAQNLVQRGVDVRKEVIVITFYAGQVRAITSELKRHHVDGVMVSTVDSFQGSEANVVILSFVRANSSGRIGFLADMRRLNVALTRAKQSLVLIGHGETLARSRNECIETLVKDAKSRGVFQEMT